MLHRRYLLAIAAAAACELATCRHTRNVEGDEKDGERADAGSRKEERGGSPEGSNTRVPPRAGHPAVSATPEGFMQPGSVHQIQEALRARGLLEEASTGRLDEATSAALRRFQSSQQLPATGAPDRETLRRLGLDIERIYRTVPQGGEPNSRP